LSYEPSGFIDNGSTKQLGSGSQIKFRFKANGYKIANSNVNWIITPNLGSYSITSIPNSSELNFNYTAPTVVSPVAITIRATSSQDSTKYTSVVLNVKPIVDYKEFKRYFNSSPINSWWSGDHWVTTGTVTSGYIFEAFYQNGIPVTVYLRNSGSTALYSCRVSNDHFVTLRSDCEGQVNLGILGYIDTTNSGPQSHVPLYRCYTGLDHFVSTDPQCEARTNEGLLGYGIINP
jgi:hypothetical protein